MNPTMFLFLFLVLAAALVGHMLGELPLKKVSLIVLVALIVFVAVFYGESIIGPFIAVFRR